MKLFFVTCVLFLSSVAFGEVSNIEAAEFALSLDEVKEKIANRSVKNKVPLSQIIFKRSQGDVLVVLEYPGCYMTVYVTENDDRTLSSLRVQSKCD